VLVAVFVAVMLASPQSRAAVMAGDGDADPRVLTADDDPSRVAIVVDLPPSAFAIPARRSGPRMPAIAYAERSTAVEHEGSRARGPP
jgi:hypothetical protein